MGVHDSACVMRLHSLGSRFLRLPYFSSKSPSAWSAGLLDAIVAGMDTAVADVLAHVMGHFNGRNLSGELLVELWSLGFCFMKPQLQKGGVSGERWAAHRRSLQGQWALIFKVRPADVDSAPRQC